MVETFSNYCRLCGAAVPEADKGVWRDLSPEYANGIVCKAEDMEKTEMTVEINPDEKRANFTCLASTIFPGLGLIALGLWARGLILLIPTLLILVMMASNPGLFFIPGLVAMPILWLISISWTYCGCRVMGLVT